MKHIVISGAGEVGRYSAQVAQNHGLKVTVIEMCPAAIERIENSTDARIVAGSACHADVLRRADVPDCDVLIAATSLDEVNLLTASIGKQMGAKTVMARIHNTAYFDGEFDYRESLGIDHFICPEKLTARAIASDLREPGSNLVPRFAQNEIEIRNFSVDKNSRSAGMSLKELTMPPGVRVAIIRRKGKRFTPDADTILNPDDEVSLIGPNDAFKHVPFLFSKGNSGKKQSIAIVGAGTVTEWFLKKTDFRQYHIKLFERNTEAAEKIAVKFRKITVINEDAMDADIFSGEHLEDCSSFLALSEHQEQNILAAMQAKKLGVPNVTALIQSSDFLKILSDTGIDHLYSPRIEAARALMHIIDDSPIKVLATPDKKVSLIFQVKVREDSHGVGKSLAELNFPPRTFVAAIERGPGVFCPVYSDKVCAGDILITIGPRSLRDYLEQTFIFKKG